jgi:hypothetical protein
MQALPISLIFNVPLSYEWPQLQTSTVSVQPTRRYMQLAASNNANVRLTVIRMTGF